MGNCKVLNRPLKSIQRSALISSLLYGYYNIFKEEIFDFGLCNGESMKPALDHNTFVLIKKFDFYNVKRGDVVVYRDPHDPYKLVCKRVIHLQYDIAQSSEGPVEVKKGCVWLEGENSAVSLDSRSYGAIPKGLLMGKVIFVIWPFGKSLKIS